MKTKKKKETEEPGRPEKMQADDIFFYSTESDWKRNSWSARRGIKERVNPLLLVLRHVMYAVRNTDRDRE